MKKAIFLLCLIILSGCTFETTVSETVECENCSSSLFSFGECKPICEERFESAKGSIIFNKEVTKLKKYSKNIRWENGVKTVSCVCTYD
jgi:hypothetical protein